MQKLRAETRLISIGRECLAWSDLVVVAYLAQSNRLSTLDYKQPESHLFLFSSTLADSQLYKLWAHLHILVTVG